MVIMNKADTTYRSFLPFTGHPVNLSSYVHLCAHIGAYMFFSIFPTIEAKYPSTDYNNNIPMFDVVRVRDRILGY